MATAFTGTRGSLAMTDSTLATAQEGNVDRWALSLDRDSHDVSTFEATQNATDAISGLYGKTGSASGKWDTALANVVVMTNFNNSEYAGETITLTSAASRTYSGLALISELVWEIGTNQPTTFSIQFTISGPLTVA